MNFSFSSNPEEKRKQKETLARQYAANPTPSELRLFNALHQRGHYFQFQAIVLGYIPDFYFPTQSAVVEVDGSAHRSAVRQEYDDKRDEAFRNHGYRVLRVTNYDVSKRLQHTIRSVELFVYGQTRQAIKPSKSEFKAMLEEARQRRQNKP